MPYTSHVSSSAGFIADHNSIDRLDGRQIDWANVSGTSPKKLAAGTVVGTLLGVGKISPRVVTTNPARGILAEDAVEGDKNAALSGYGVIIGGAIYEALLPEATGTPRVLAAAVKTELNTAGVGTGFAWLEYIDTR